MHPFPKRSENLNVYFKCKQIRQSKSVEYSHKCSNGKGQTKHFSNLECTRAKSARNLQNVPMGLSDKDLAYTIKNNTIGYNTLRRKDVNNAKEIFGPSESIFKAKTVQKKSKII